MSRKGLWIAAVVVIVSNAYTLGSARLNRMGEPEARVEQSLQQTARSQREATVADRVPGGRVAPRGADVVVVEKRRVPACGIAHEAVPLRHQQMRRTQVLGEAAQHELRIRLDSTHMHVDHAHTSRRRRQQRRSREQQHLSESNLRHAALQRPDRQRGIARVDAAQRHVRQLHAHRRGRRFSPRRFDTVRRRRPRSATS